MNLRELVRSRPHTERANAIGLTQSGVSPWPFTRNEFQSYVQGGLKNNGVIWACVAARSWVFADVRFVWERGGEFIDTPSLRVFDNPQPGVSRRQMLKRWEQDISFAGNAYLFRNGPKLERWRPDLVDSVLDDDRELMAYAYWENGRDSGDPPRIEPWEMVAHGMDTPDPERPYVGLSWLNPIITEIQSDGQMTKHKSKFFKNAATPNLLVTVEKRISSDEKRQQFRSELDRKFAGVDNAYSTLLLDDGADGKVIGANMQQLDFAVTQAAGENRIASAAGVPPIVLGIKEGLDAATYSNYAQAMRAFADHKISPKWGETAEQLQRVVAGPDGARLWYDSSRVAALQQDAQDQAAINQTKANTIRSLIDAGFEAESVVDAVERDDMSLLEHSGLPSVQLQGSGSVSIGGDDGTEDDDD